MPDGITFQTRVVFNQFPRVRAGMMNVARQAVAKAALDIQAQAQSRAAVDTGFLRSSIQARQVGGNATSGSITWRVTVTAEYGVYVEYGTRFMDAQPFFFPAIEEVAPTFLEAMRRISTL